MRNLTIVFHDAGGGHRNAALALKAVLEQQDYPWNVRLLNLQELLDPIDVVHRATGHRLQDGYNLLLRKGWTRLTPQLLVLLQCTIRLHQPRIVRMLRNFWAQHPADLLERIVGARRVFRIDHHARAGVQVAGKKDVDEVDAEAQRNGC